MDVHSYIDTCDTLLIQQGAKRSLLFELDGYAVYAYSIHSSHASKSIYLSTGVHGDEPAGPMALLRLLQEGFLDSNFSWYICPVINPTGLATGTRENAQGIDLNRDYLVRSSTEVKGHVAWLKDKKIDCTLSLHEDWESSGFYFYEINQNADDSGVYEALMKSMAFVIPIEPSAVIDGHKVREKGWIYHDDKADEPSLWPEAIYLADMGCPLSFTFETPSSLQLECRIAAHALAVRTTLQQIK